LDDSYDQALMILEEVEDGYVTGPSTKIEDLIQVGQGASFVQEERPSDPVIDGVRWYKPSEATTYVWYMDDDSGQWVEENPSVVDAPNRIIPFATVAEATADTSLAEGNTIQIAERANGIFDVISGTGTANTWNIVAHGSLSLSLSERPPIETTEARTWYVDASLGTDGFGKGVSSGAGAFRTIQYAYDQLPDVINHEQVIQLADGTYNDNYLPSTTSVELPRPAILFGRGKTITARTQKNGNTLNGGIILKGNTTTPANVVIEPTDTYSYGIYNGEGQLGIQAFHIRPASGSTAIDNLLTSHRMDSYVHAVDVTVDGRDKAVTSFGLLTESGGQMEFTTTNLSVEVKNCATLAKALTPGDNLNIAGDVTMSTADNGLFATSMGRVNFNAATITGQTISGCSNFAAIATDGGQISMRGANDSNHITIDGNVSLETNSTLTMVWTDITGTTTSENSVISLNNSDYQEQITLDGGAISFNGSDSFISPATANDSTIPVLLTNGATKATSGTNNFNGSGGLSLHAQSVTEQTIAADSTTISIPDELHATVRLNTAANRLSCVLPAGTYQWQTVEIFGFAGFSVQIIESTTATIANNTVKISGLSAADEYMGIKFIWRGTNWYEISRSRAGA